MPSSVWSDVSIRIDGKTLDGVYDVGVDYAGSDADGAPSTPRSYACSATFEISGREAEAFSLAWTIATSRDFAALRRHFPGAAIGVLQRRVKYGGRKGRSALRRLYRFDAMLASVTYARRRLRRR
jgi:hypothetical protein